MLIMAEINKTRGKKRENNSNWLIVQEFIIFFTKKWEHFQ